MSNKKFEYNIKKELEKKDLIEIIDTLAAKFDHYPIPIYKITEVLNSKNFDYSCQKLLNLLDEICEKEYNYTKIECILAED